MVSCRACGRRGGRRDGDARIRQSDRAEPQAQPHAAIRLDGKGRIHPSHPRAGCRGRQPLERGANRPRPPERSGRAGAGSLAHGDRRKCRSRLRRPHPGAGGIQGLAGLRPDHGPGRTQHHALQPDLGPTHRLAESFRAEDWRRRAGAGRRLPLCGQDCRDERGHPECLAHARHVGGRGEQRALALWRRSFTRRSLGAGGHVPVALADQGRAGDAVQAEQRPAQAGRSAHRADAEQEERRRTGQRPARRPDGRPRSLFRARPLARTSRPGRGRAGDAAQDQRHDGARSRARADLGRETIRHAPPDT